MVCYSIPRCSVFVPISKMKYIFAGGEFRFITVI